MKIWLKVFKSFKWYGNLEKIEWGFKILIGIGTKAY